MIRMIKLRKLKWVLHMACTGIRGMHYRVWVGKPEGVRPLGKYRLRREDNIKNGCYRNRMGWCGLD
jgi:hypothetical protein